MTTPRIGVFPQLFPIRLSTCNLHGKHNEAGISVIITNINLRQFVLSIPINQAYSATADCWLEAGGVCLGPVSVDAALALPKPEYRELQDGFLKYHDAKTHRLWFMWPAGACDGDAQLYGNCGCRGNCTFFGLNRNGPRFFQPSEEDFAQSYATAVFHICVNENSFGYGQSILATNQLIFTHLPSTSFLSTPTRHFLSRKLSTNTITVPSSDDTFVTARTGSTTPVASAVNQKPRPPPLVVHSEQPMSQHVARRDGVRRSGGDGGVTSHRRSSPEAVDVLDTAQRPADLPLGSAVPRLQVSEWVQ